MPFDPDAYLKSKPAAPDAFDPDAYLKGAAPDTPEAHNARLNAMGVPTRGGPSTPTPSMMPSSPLDFARTGLDAGEAVARTAGNIAGTVGGGLVGAFAGATDYADAAIKHLRGQDTSKIKLRGPDEGIAAANEGISGLMDTIFGKQSERSQAIQQAPGRAMDKLGVKPEALMGLPAGGMGAGAVPAGVQRAGQLAAPPMRAAGEMAGAPARAAGGLMRSTAQDLMQSALKPPLKALQTGKGQAAVDTMLENGINVSKAGAEKLQGKISVLNDQIAEKIANSKAVVDKQAVMGRMQGLIDKFTNQVAPSSDIVAIQRAFDDFDKHPKLTNDKIGVQLAQQLKQGTYKSLGDKAYGELKGADIEAQKAMARGLKDEIAKMVPEVHKLNAEESKLLNALPLVERRALMEANKNPFGLGWMTTDPAKFAGWMADRSGAFKSIVARMLYQGSKKLAPLKQEDLTKAMFKEPEVPGLSLAPAGERIPNLPRDQGRQMPPMTLGRSQMMSSSPGAGIPRPPVETIPAEGLYEPFKPAKPAKSLASDILGIDFHPTPIADEHGFVARTAAEQEALRHPSVKASQAAQRKAAEEAKAKKKTKKDDQ